MIVNLLAATIVAIVLRGWFRRKRPYYIILTDKDLIYRERGREKARCPLSLIRLAEHNSLSQEIMLYGCNGERVGSLPNLYSRDYLLIANLCSTIEHRAGAAPKPVEEQ